MQYKRRIAHVAIGENVNWHQDSAIWITMYWVVICTCKHSMQVFFNVAVKCVHSLNLQEMLTAQAGQ